MNSATLRSPGLRIEHASGLDPAALLAAWRDDGRLIKQSRRTRVRRVGGLAIKESSAQNLLQALDLTLRPGRYTKAWTLGRQLRDAGISIPAPLASIRLSRWGLCIHRATVTEWLEGWGDVEQAARTLHDTQASPCAIAAFLHGIGDLFSRLSGAGFIHEDLSGKNIYCRPTDHHFDYALIDLDSARAARITSSQRFRNAVQLYDSFCDLWDEATLAPLIATVMNTGASDTHTLRRVVAAQQTRRARIEAIWARQR